METDGKTRTHHQTIAEKFNNYYVSFVDNSMNNNPVNNAINDLNKINRQIIYILHFNNLSQI